jgi:hypothetical protein
MPKQKFIQILLSLDKAELKQAARFLASPFHNSNKNIIRLFEYLKSAHPNYTEENIKLEMLHKKVFPSKTFNEKIIRNLVYELNERLIEFLAVKNFLNDSFAFEKHLIRESEKLKLPQIAAESIKRADGILSGVDIRDENYYNSRVFIEQARYAYEFSEVPMGKNVVLSNIREAYIKNASSYFILLMISEYFAKKNREKQVNSAIELKLSEHIISFLDTEIENYKNETPVYLLYKFIKLTPETTNDEYFKLKELTLNNRNKISNSIFSDFILELYNHCKTKQQLGSSEYSEEAFGLLEFMDENNLLLEPDGSVLEHNYTNAAAAALRMKKTDWALSFIQKYKVHLAPAIRENAYYYNMAALNFILGVNSGKEKSLYLEKAMDFLKAVKTEDFYHTTRVNNLLLMTYYEQGVPEPAFSLIDTYRHFLHSNKLIPKNLQKRYQNFINYVHRLMHIVTGSKKTSVDRLRQDVLNNETEYKKWLLAKIDELEKKNNK